jgi:hypothetical protein
MRSVKIAEFKSQLSRHLRDVQNSVPVAKLKLPVCPRIDVDVVELLLADRPVADDGLSGFFSRAAV